MKLTVNKNLNIRVGAASTEAPSFDFARPGDTIEVAQVLTGTQIDGNNIWCLATNGNYYWSGGLDTSGLQLSVPGAAAASGQNDLSKNIIIKNPVQADGSNIIIGILDTAIDAGHPSLGAALLSVENYLTQQPVTTVQSDHGTKVAGILVGNDDSITGLATGAKIKSYITNDSHANTDNIAVVNALKHIVDNNINIDILNLSLDINTTVANEVQAYINTLVSLGMIIVVAGFDPLFGGPSNIAAINGTFAAGVIEESDFAAVKANGLDQVYQLSFLNKSINSLSTSGHAPIGSSSAYAAVTTGIIARFLSSRPIPSASRITEVKNYLAGASFNIRQETALTYLKPYRNETV